MGRGMNTVIITIKISHSRNISLPRSRERCSMNPETTRGRKNCVNSCEACGEKNIAIDMLNWTCRKFSELTADELYAILRLRSEVFVVEQNCVFLDMDNKDQQCHHLCGWENGSLLGYSRIVP